LSLHFLGIIFARALNCGWCYRILFAAIAGLDTDERVTPNRRTKKQHQARAKSAPPNARTHIWKAARRRHVLDDLLGGVGSETHGGNKLD